MCIDSKSFSDTNSSSPWTNNSPVQWSFIMFTFNLKFDINAIFFFYKNNKKKEKKKKMMRVKVFVAFFLVEMVLTA